MDLTCIHFLSDLLAIASYPEGERATVSNQIALIRAKHHVCYCRDCEATLKQAMTIAERRDEQTWNLYVRCAVDDSTLFADMALRDARLRFAAIAMIFSGGCEEALSRLVTCDVSQPRMDEPIRLHEAALHVSFCGNCRSYLEELIQMIEASDVDGFALLNERFPGRHALTIEKIGMHGRWLRYMLSPTRRVAVPSESRLQQACRQAAARLDLRRSPHAS